MRICSNAPEYTVQRVAVAPTGGDVLKQHFERGLCGISSGKGAYKRTDRVQVVYSGEP